MTIIHELKIYPLYYDAITHENILHRKTCEIRKMDRDYKVGDVLELQEYDPETKIYTGKKIHRRIIHIVSGQPWLPEGIAVLSLY